MAKKEKLEPTPKEYLINGDNYYPNTVAKKTASLPSGAYSCHTTIEGIPYFSPINIMTDKIIDIPNSVTEDVINEITNFWSDGVSEKFKEYGLVHKRGVLLAGRPGTGKTVTLARTAEIVIDELDGVVLFNPSAGDLSAFLRLIKEIEPTRKILVIWEEFDSIIGGYESELLSLLDGEVQVGNIVYLATTNYLTRIPSRIKNRPSRFARIIEVVEPTAEARRIFLESKLTKADKTKHLEAMVQASDGFVMDQLKDMIISVCCFNYTIDTAVRKIKEMEEDSLGIDDYNEEQAKSVFKSKAKNYKSKPLQPLK